MPAPFPGMDPYLEAPAIWPDLHDALAGEIRGELNRSLPGPYYARLEMRPEIGIVEEDGSRQWIVPDVAVVRQGQQPEGPAAAVAVLEPEQAETARSIEVTIRGATIRHPFVEVRDPTQGHKLITLIEILSPSNKRRGLDRQAYRKKQDEVLESDASLIELDLLRNGERVLPHVELAAAVGRIEPPPTYLVLINRGWRRLTYQVIPVGLRGPLPRIPIPLKPGEPELPLDLQTIFNRAYDGGPYRRGAVDYGRPPVPPLSGDDATWAEAVLRERGLRPA
jgi:hypothetical protein